MQPTVYLLMEKMSRARTAVRRQKYFLKSTFIVCAASAAPLIFGVSALPAQAQLKGKTDPVAAQKTKNSDSTPRRLERSEIDTAAPPKSGSPVLPSSPQSDIPQAVIGGNHLDSNMSVLLLAVDEAELRHASDWESTDDSEGETKKEGSSTAKTKNGLAPVSIAVNNRPPGKSQMAAAPLRRVIAGAGAKDVLSTPLDGPSIVRLVNGSHLSLRTLSDARSSLRHIEDGVLRSDSNSMEIPAELQSDIATSLTRIGQAAGYRAVVALLVPSATAADAPQAVLVAVDSQQESAQIIPVFTDGGTSSEGIAAASAKALLPRLNKWESTSTIKTQRKADDYFEEAQKAAKRGDLEAAQDLMHQVVGLQPNNANAYEALGEMLQEAAPRAAASAYTRALEITPDNGELWSKLALSYTLGSKPDWPRSLSAAKKAIAADYDSALLRTIMASAEFGRAQIFRKAGRTDQADTATRQAKEYLDLAMKLSPRSAEVSANVSKLIATNLVNAERFDEAATTLDTAARQHPEDTELQRLYAQSLSETSRNEDAFVAWAAVWKLEKRESVPMDSARYKKLTNGFDKHVFNLARSASVLTSSVAEGNVPAAMALPQLQQYSDMIKESLDALRLMEPPRGSLTTSVHPARLIAGDMFAQAIESYVLYLQDGDKEVLAHGGQLHYQAIERLNSVRKAG